MRALVTRFVTAARVATQRHHATSRCAARPGKGGGGKGSGSPRIDSDLASLPKVKAACIEPMCRMRHSNHDVECRTMPHRVLRVLSLLRSASFLFGIIR